MFLGWLLRTSSKYGKRWALAGHKDLPGGLEPVRDSKILWTNNDCFLECYYCEKLKKDRITKIRLENLQNV